MQAKLVSSVAPSRKGCFFTNSKLLGKVICQETYFLLDAEILKVPGKKFQPNMNTCSVTQQQSWLPFVDWALSCFSKNGVLARANLKSLKVLETRKESGLTRGNLMIRPIREKKGQGISSKELGWLYVRYAGPQNSALQSVSFSLWLKNLKYSLRDKKSNQTTRRAGYVAHVHTV